MVSTSHSAAVAASVAGSSCSSDPCGTTRARSLALGARTPWLAQRGAAHFAKRSDVDTKRIKCNLGRGTSAASRCMDSDGHPLTAKRAPAYLGNPNPRCAIKLRWISLVPMLITHISEWRRFCS
jgi:hypothetical protein